jgi:cell division protein FtsN
MAETREDETRSADAFQDRDDVQREDRDPAEHEQDAQDTAESERRQADKAGDHDVTDEEEQLGDHQHEAVSGVPLHVGIALFEDQRHQREGPEVRQDDHDAAVW